MPKNYLKQGANHWVVGGVQDFEAGALLRLREGARLSFSPRTPVNAKASTLTTALVGDNNDLVFTAVEKGTAGDDITITYVDPAEDGDISVEVQDDTAIVVTLAYTADAITSTASDVKAAIEADDTAKLLVTVANAEGNTGEGIVTALAETPLAGGVDGTVAAVGETAIDASYLYIAIDDNTVADDNWRRIALGPAF